MEAKDIDKLAEYYRLASHATHLRDIVEQYPHRTIENVIDNLEARMKELEKLYDFNH